MAPREDGKAGLHMRVFSGPEVEIQMASLNRRPRGFVSLRTPGQDRDPPHVVTNGFYRKFAVWLGGVVSRDSGRGGLPSRSALNPRRFLPSRIVESWRCSKYKAIP